MIAAFGAPDRPRRRRAARRARRAGAAGAAGRDRHGARAASAASSSTPASASPPAPALIADSPRPGALPLGDVVEAAARLARDAAPGRDRSSTRATRALLGEAVRTGRATSGRFVLHGLGAHRAAQPRMPRSSAASASCGSSTRPSSARRRSASRSCDRDRRAGHRQVPARARADRAPRRPRDAPRRAAACPTGWGSPTGRSARWSSRRRAGGRSRRSPRAWPTGRRPRPRSPAPSASARARPARRPRGASGGCSPPSRATARWCSGSRTSTGRSRRCSTLSTTSPRG